MSKETLDKTIDQEHLARDVRQFARQTDWMLPARLLAAKAAKSRGSNIEDSLVDLADGQGILLVTDHEHAPVVVMSIDHYESMLQMKSYYSMLIERFEDSEIAEGINEFEASYKRITSPASRRAVDALFEATEEDLRKAYKPGGTETR